MGQWRVSVLVGVLVALLCVSGCAAARTGSAIADDVPRTAGSLEPAEDTFRFAIVGDRTGGHRPGVFADAMRKLDLLRPDFVISVGDLIEGYTEDEAVIHRQWDEVECRISSLSTPLFFIAGNHDISNGTMARIWREQRGAPYWSFVHRDVLLIGLSTEDPPYVPTAETLASTARLEQAMATNPEATQKRLLESVKQRGAPPKLPGAVNISGEQIDFVRGSLTSHADVRWTFLVMHKPAWQYSSEAFAEIEKALKGRPYTVIAGHEHYYSHETRFGRDYIVMGTTGGIWLQDGPGRVDHVAMVTMTGTGPIIANVRIDGLFGKEGQPTSIPEGEAVSSGQ